MIGQKLNLADGHLVLVEDDLEVRRSITLMLRARGFTLDVYRNGVELMSARTIKMPDCLLIDYKLPGIDGLSLLKRLRSNGIASPALLITGCINAMLPHQAKEAGFTDMLTKPLASRELVDRIGQIMSPAQL